MLIKRTAYVYYSKGASKIRLELPQGGKWVRPFLHKVLSERHKVQWDANEKVWIISKSPENFDKVLAGLLTKYEEVITEVEHSTSGICTSACQEAKNQHCECICAGEGHGGNSNYKPSLRGVLERTDTKVVTSTYRGSEPAYKPVQTPPMPWVPELEDYVEPQKTGPGPEGFEESYEELLAMLGRSEFDLHFG